MVLNQKIIPLEIIFSNNMIFFMKMLNNIYNNKLFNIINYFNF